MDTAVTWERLLSARKLARAPAPESRSRSPFQQDADLVVFSAAFRRLQDKTQVHPMAARGKVRTRLTHSIEVASVGRSLGLSCGLSLADRGLVDRERAEAMSHVVYAACLAHDIGNPPFGHAGEDALSDWFTHHPEQTATLSSTERDNLCRFEGNAQGFRILTQLENYVGAGGLRLTYATLGAFMKYTVGVGEARSGGAAAERKPGFFFSERPHVLQVRAGLGLVGTQRHPLAFLTEAADDICYAIIDIEDGHAMELIPHFEARTALEALAATRADTRLSAHAQLQKLRGIAIGRLVEQVAARFVELETALRCGVHDQPLLDGVASGDDVAAAKALSAQHVFCAPTVASQQRRGKRILAALLDVFVPVALSLDGDAETATQPDPLLCARLSELPGEPLARGARRAERLRWVVDGLSALTDAHAQNLSEELCGESLGALPSRAARNDEPLKEL